MGSAALAAAVPYPVRPPEFPARDSEVLKKKKKKRKEKSIAKPHRTERTHRQVDLNVALKK